MCVGDGVCIRCKSGVCMWVRVLFLSLRFDHLIRPLNPTVCRGKHVVRPLKSDMAKI